MAKAATPAADDDSAKPAKGKPKAAAGAKKPAAPKAAPAPITGPVEGGFMKLKPLLDRVVARSGSGRMVARPVVDAVLIELGEALRRGETLALPGLGKIKVKTPKEGAKGPGIPLRLLPMAEGGAKKDSAAPLAPAED
jgi:DNA-binding protein HU-alpha